MACTNGVPAGIMPWKFDVFHVKGKLNCCSLNIIGNVLNPDNSSPDGIRDVVRNTGIIQAGNISGRTIKNVNLNDISNLDLD